MGKPSALLSYLRETFRLRFAPLKVNMLISGLIIFVACMLTKQKKQNVIKKYQLHEGDTGSTEVQVAILSLEIDELASHLKQHHKDHSSRRGLLRKVGERRRLLRYLKKENAQSYETLVKKLKLKQAKPLMKMAQAMKEDDDYNDEKEDENTNE